jgi:hypothetical protein
MHTPLASNWSSFLERPVAADHGVQVYRDVSELARSVASYLAAGFEAGEPAVVIATAEHWDLFAARLRRHSWDAGDLEQMGLLEFGDAEATLAAIMVDGRPDPTRFDDVVGGVLDTVSGRFPGRRIRAFGEMVDLLCIAGNPRAAVALEALWNELAARKSFALLCGYRLDVFDRDSQTSVLPNVCRAHSHVLPAEDTARLQVAVDAALDDALGRDAGKVYAMAAAEFGDTHVPPVQQVLMWVSENLPSLAERILESARDEYVQAPAPAA